jgi:hypothetical protein
MSKLVLTDLNLNKNELQNAVIQNLSSAPSNPLAGQMYFDTVDGVTYIYDGTEWRNALSTGDYTFQNGIEELTGDDAGKVQIKLATGDDAGNVTLTANSNGLKGEVADATTSAAGVVEYATDYGYEDAAAFEEAMGKDIVRDAIQADVVMEFIVDNANIMDAE